MLKKVMVLILAICICIVCIPLKSFADANIEVTLDDKGLDTEKNLFTKYAENSFYELYLIEEGMRKGEFYIRNKLKGGCFYSNPQNRDMSEDGLTKSENESSQILLQIYSAESGAIRTLSSFKGTAKGKYLTIISKNQGFDASYQINNAIKITLKYRLTEKGLSVESDFSKVNFSKENVILSVQLLPYFSSSAYGEAGYMLVPDGSGALIYNNTEKRNASQYSQKLYGTDYAFGSMTKAVDTQAATMPIFGLKNNNGGFIAVIDNGAANASIFAMSAYNESMYNRVYPSFDLVGSDKITLGNSGSAFTASAETYAYDCPLTENVKVNYLFTSETDDYSEMASLYREHIGLNRENIPISPSLFLEFYGGFTRKESFLGIPVTVFKKLTTIEQAQKVVSYFDNEIDSAILVSYRNIDSAIISGKIQNKFRLKGAIGTKKELNQLYELLNGNLYLENNILSAKKSGNGFLKFTGIASRINRSNVLVNQYNLATTGIDSEKQESFVLKLTVLNKIYNKYLSSVTDKGYESAFINLANTAYSDFTSKKYTSRQEAINTFTTLLSNYGKNGMLYSPNAYAFKHGKYISDTPINSSGYDLIDVDIPFYQMVLSGVKEFSTVSVNLNANTKSVFLKAIESGASLKFTFIYDNITAIKNTDFDFLFGADFSNRKQETIKYQQELEKVYKKLNSRIIKNHTILQENVRVTEFENGNKVVINYSDADVTTEYGIVKAQSYIIIKKGG